MDGYISIEMSGDAHVDLGMDPWGRFFEGYRAFNTEVHGSRPTFMPGPG